MSKGEIEELTCPKCGGNLEVVHDQDQAHSLGIVHCEKCGCNFGSWDEFKQEFLDPMKGESQDARRHGKNHHHHR